jgi:hypothetical protein
MTRPRYIVRNPEEATAPDDEEEFERTSNFFITARTSGPPDDFETAPLTAILYGVDNLFGQNFHVAGDDNDDDSQWGVPIHNSCWQMFQRVSQLLLGKVDVQGFMALWEVSHFTILIKS